MTQRIDFVSRDGKPTVGELALPAEPGKHPAVIVAHEWYGLNDDMRRICERFASEGVVALAVDLFDGRVTTDTEVAKQLAHDMKTADAVEIIAGATERLMSHPRVNGKVFAAGFCLGGAMALAASCKVMELAGAIGFYGVPGAQHVDWSENRCPTLGHFGKEDQAIPVEKAEALFASMREAGVDATLYLYDAGHAFMREHDPKAYDERAAKVAWARTIDFIRKRA